MTKFSIVEIDGVTSSVPSSNFKESDLDILADLILESGGVLKPLVLKKIGFEKYEVIDGHFEYYAAVRAREKNPNRGEIVNAFIIPSEKENIVLNQLAILKEITFPSDEKLLKPNEEISQLPEIDDYVPVSPVYPEIKPTETQVILKEVNKLSLQVELIDKNLNKHQENLTQQIQQITETLIKKMIDEFAIKPKPKPKTGKKVTMRMRKDELSKIAEQKGIEITLKTRKQDIVDAINKIE